MRPIHLFFVLILSLINILISPCLNAQERRIFDPNRSNVLTVNQPRLKVLSLENDNIESIDTLSEIQISPGEKKIILYNDKIQKPKKSVQNYFNQHDLIEERVPNLVKQTKPTFQLIPEMHLIPGDTESDDKAFWVFFTTSFPMRYDFADRIFKGIIRFILLEESDDYTSTSRIDPVLIEVGSEKIKSIDPKRIQIDHLNIPSTEIMLANENLSDSAKIRIITASNPNGYETYIKMESPLKLSCEKVIMQGYGIQKTPIVITLSGTDSADSVEVYFEVNRGTVIPNPVKLTTNQSKIIHLRSQGTGKAKIFASTSNFESNSEVINYLFPITFLLFTLLGGLLGGFGKYFRKEDKKISFKTILGGVFFGIVAVGAWYVLGINLLRFSLPDFYNEAAVFFISAIAAWGLTPKPK